MIFKLVRRNIGANWGRLALTLLSVVLGVAFVSGSFLLADSLRAIFAEVSEQAFAGIDAEIRSSGTELTIDGVPPRFADSVVEEVAALDEVGEAEGGVATFEDVFTIGEDGTPNKPNGPPTFAFSWGGPDAISSFDLAEGRAPGPGEIAIDTTQAQAAGLEIGDITMVANPLGEPEPFEVVGTVLFGDASLGGAYFNLFDLETLQRLVGAEGELDVISLSAASGVATDELVSAVEGVIDTSELEVNSQEVLIEEFNSDFAFFIDIFGNILLAFAFVVLFVSIFLIYNTFVILVGQRLRQFGLLRAVGATGGQLRALVLVESLVIGVLASIIGLFGGIAVAWLLKQLFSSGGNGAFPEGPIVFRPRTIIIVFAVGIGVTMLSAIAPAIRASRIPPIAAISGLGVTEQSSRRRLILGLLALVPGAVLLGYGMFGTIDGVAPRLTYMGVGTVLVFVGSAMLSVLVATPLTRMIGWPIQKLRGITGRLARDNASRNPQRSAATATALMIGLALIAGVTVLQQSIKASLEAVLAESVGADVVIADENGVGFFFPGEVVDQIAAVPEVEAVAGTITILVRNLDDPDQRIQDVDGFDLATATAILDPDIVDGSIDAGTSGVLVADWFADTEGIELGDEVRFEFQDEAVEAFEVVGVFSNSELFNSPWLLDRSVTASHSPKNEVNFVGASFADGVDIEEGQAAVTAALADFPNVTVQSNAEFRDELVGQVDAILVVIGGLLALCIVVAFIGIVNTMALSVLERTREIGLLRAVGTTRSQLRTSVRWEAVIVSSFGAVLGVALGVVLGWAAVLAIPDEFVSKVAVPWWIVMFLFVGAGLGVFAALIPAQRAARLNVLDAVTHD